jgi:SAM-dependent methyltransferase
MTVEVELAVEARIERLLDHLGIRRAHFGAQLSTELNPILAARPERIASLALMGPSRLTPEAVAGLAERLLIITAETGLPSEVVARAAPELPEARTVTLAGYEAATWSDLAADRTDDVAGAINDFLAAAEGDGGADSLSMDGGAGEVAGITYRIAGSGPVLVLLPLFLAASQWQPLVPRLSDSFTVVQLGGPHLGGIAILEDRGNDPGYRRVVGSVVDELNIQPGQRIVDVGGGSGAIDRWLARRTQGANPITAFDVNAYLRREARALADAEGLGEVIEFREGNAEALPLETGSADVTLSVTVMEECNAERMLAELIRVTRPGGRIGVIVRAVDLPTFWALDLPPETLAKVNIPIHSVSPGGCADASLYRRFRASGLTEMAMFPHMMTTTRADGPLWKYTEPFALSLLAPAEVAAWHRAKARAIAEDTALMGRPMHCAVGTKPG